MDPARNIQLDVNGLRFDALCVGDPRSELVLFLHGFPDFADAWLTVLYSVGANGYYAVAVDQRGYSTGARPSRVEDYGTSALISDVLGFADALRADRFHLVGHDWGGLLAWCVAAEHPNRTLSLSVLFEALESDPDQKQRSRYIDFFRTEGAPEAFFAAADYEALRRVYHGKVAAERVEANVRRLSEPGALTAALNWYRNLDVKARIGTVQTATLFVWGSNDLAIGCVQLRTRRSTLRVRFATKCWTANHIGCWMRRPMRSHICYSSIWRPPDQVREKRFDATPQSRSPPLLARTRVPSLSMFSSDRESLRKSSRNAG